MNVVRRVRSFLGETVGELKKTSWPTKKDLKRSAVVVVMGTLIVGAYVAIVDFSLFQVVNLLVDMLH